MLFKKIVFFRLFFLLILAEAPLPGQKSLTFFFMHDVPQSNLVNPAIQSACRLFIGVPGLSSIHVNYNNTAFAYGDILNRISNTDSLQLNLDQWVKQLHRTDLIGFETVANVFSLGIRYRRYYFTFNLTEKAEASGFIPGELVELAWWGNSRFLGEKAKFNSLGVSANYYREYAIGISKIVDKTLSLGVRAKMLFGKANITTSRGKGSLFTNKQTFDLLLRSSFRLNSSFPLTTRVNEQGNLDQIDIEENIDWFGLLMNGQNKGLSFDGGFVYDYDEKIQLSGSILDLGLIRWKSDVSNFTQDGEISYTGTGDDSDFNSAEYINNLIDTLENEFGVKVKNKPYISFLSPKIYVGGTYRLSPVFRFGVLNYSRIYRSKLYSSFSLSLNADLPRYFSGCISYSLMNNSFNNLGIGLGFGKRGFQMHLVSDNVLGFIKPANTRNLNVRLGMNLLLGCSRTKRSKGQGCAWIREMEEKQNKKDWKY